MATEHTPLPWVVLGPRSDGKLFIKPRGRTGGSAIAVVSYGNMRYAAFIVRACNNHAKLLEALKAIYRVADTASLPGPVHLSIAEVEAAGAAIAEAEGETK